MQTLFRGGNCHESALESLQHLQHYLELVRPTRADAVSVAVAGSIHFGTRNLFQAAEASKNMPLSHISSFYHDPELTQN